MKKIKQKKNNNFLYAIKDSIELKKKLTKIQKETDVAIQKIYRTLKNKKKILICGNGGSAADAQHLAAEFLIRLNPKINRVPFPVISLAQDTSTITACGNDLGFSNLFSRNLQGMANRNDLLLVLSTSGNSKNILKVLNYLFQIHFRNFHKLKKQLLLIFDS